MQNSSCDASPALWPRSCPQVERGSHWKSRDQVSAAAWQQAAEGLQKTTRRRISQHPRSDTGHGQAQSKALLEDAISSTTVSFTHAETPVYKYTRSKLYTVRDEEHKSLVLQSHAGQALLVAVHLQGPKISEEVKLTLDLYRSPHRSPKRTNPVAMNIVENHLYLCCVLAGDSPVLQLEHPWSSFESAAHPGWFIGTSKANDKPVRMVNRTGEQDITDFSVLEV
nr:interleukin-1 beta-like [Pelodiscus sinensis]|eukprot:XP_014427335.1 interleukin-1 beta-like [Pelodiscus sinensis]